MTLASQDGDTFAQRLTKEAITEFLLPKSYKEPDTEQIATEVETRKKVLREAILRFHPDKFEGRFMRLLVEKEKEIILEATNQVFRCVNALMAENS